MRNKKLFQKTKACDMDFRVLLDEELEAVTGGTDVIESEEALDNSSETLSDFESMEKKLADLAVQSVGADINAENSNINATPEESIDNDYNADAVEEVIDNDFNTDTVEEVIDNDYNADAAEEVIDNDFNTDIAEEVIDNDFNTDTAEEVIDNDFNTDTAEEVIADSGNSENSNNTVESSNNTESEYEIVEISGNGELDSDIIEISGDDSTAEPMTDDLTDNILVESSVDATQVETLPDGAVEDNVNENKTLEDTTETQSDSDNNVTVVKDKSGAFDIHIPNTLQNLDNKLNKSIIRVNQNSSDTDDSSTKLLPNEIFSTDDSSTSGYTLSDRMRVQIRSLEQANYNAQNGREMLKVADEKLSSTIDILKTLKERVITAANDTNTDTDRKAIQKEIDAMLEQIDENALVDFNGKNFNPVNTDESNNETTANQKEIDATIEQIVKNARVDISDRNYTNLIFNDMRTSALGLSGEGRTVSVADKTNATATLKVIDNALQRALNQQASIGALSNRLEFTSQNLTSSFENLESPESTYRDADIAKEMSEFTKNNILMQASQSMLAQANQLPQGILSLLQ